MSSELKNIPLKGLFPLPDELADAPTQARATFWKLIGTEALRLKRQEILSGIDRWGNKFVPVKRKWGNPTPLIPHGEASRTYRLLALNSSAQGATLFWRSGDRVPWPTIMGYHAYKHGPRSLPVRDEIGLSPKSVKLLMAQSDIWKAGYEAGLEWASKHLKDLKMTRASIERPERFPTSKAGYERRLKEKLQGGTGAIRGVEGDEKTQKAKAPPKKPPKPVQEHKLTKAEDRRQMVEADRLTHEAQKDTQKIMDDLRLEAIRKRHAEEEAVKKKEAKRKTVPKPVPKPKPEPIVPPVPKPVASKPLKVKVQEKLKAEVEKQVQTENKAKAAIAPPEPDMAHLMAKLHTAFEQEDLKTKSQNLVSLDKLKAHFPELTMQEFHDLVNRARRERLYSTETHEGTAGKLTEEMKKAAIREGQAAPKVYLSK